MTYPRIDRRTFVATAAAAGATLALGSGARAANRKELRIALVGCGGRGTGAAMNALEADQAVRIVAMGDLFPDRLASSRTHLAKAGDRGTISDEFSISGWDAYTRIHELGADIDYIILATPPHFRPSHLAEAIARGCHVFMEKPVAVDPTGIRLVAEAGAQADARGLSIVAGTQRRHERCYLDMMDRIRNGQIGEIVGGRCHWNMGGLWKRPRQEQWSDMEWQLRNWLYFTWLSGDHIVEQHIHNIDVMNWAIGSHPIAARGMGGREVRDSDDYGHIFDHHAVEFEYPSGVIVSSYCRQIDGCHNLVAERIVGTKGVAESSSGRAAFTSGPSWRFGGENPNPYIVEHQNLIASIRGAGTYLNEAQRVAESTMSAIMGRISCYSGKELTWDDAWNMDLDLSPQAYAFGPLATPMVAVPGTTPHGETHWPTMAAGA